MSIRRAYAIAAGITWFGLGFGLILTAFNVYPPVNVPPGLFGVNPDGLAGLVGRVVDYMSAFTDLRTSSSPSCSRCLLETPTGADASGTRCAWIHW